jgi:hypothetical protein
MRAHRAARGAPRPADEEFLEFAGRVEDLLDRVLARFTARYINVFTRLDELLAEGPSSKSADRLKTSFPQNDACLSYFLGRAPAEWLRPLARSATSRRRPGWCSTRRTAPRRCRSGPSRTSSHGYRPTPRRGR